MRRILSLAVVAAFAVTSLSAADLGRYKDWDESPQGYFMTKAERQEWAKVTTEDEAAKFVSDFLAKRGERFAEEIAERAANADKYLTVGKTPGSKTLRGKLVILFGPPTGLHVEDRTKVSSFKRDNPVVGGALSNINSAATGGRHGDDTAAVSAAATGTATLIRTYTITFGDRTFIVEADGATGKDRFPSKSEEQKADDAFERAAKASIRK